MNILRRAIVVLAGLLTGGAGAFVILPLLILFDSPVPDTGEPSLLLALLAAILHADDPERLGASVLFVWAVMITVCVLPLCVAALSGEILKLRTWIWYSASTASLAAALPIILRAGMSGTIRRVADPAVTASEHRLLLLLFITGILSGSLYWLIAGRSAGGNFSSRTGAQP